MVAHDGLIGRRWLPDVGVTVLVHERYLEKLTDLLPARCREALEFEDTIGDPEQRSTFIALNGEDCPRALPPRRLNARPGPGSPPRDPSEHPVLS